MALYEITLHRKVVEYRIMKVEARDGNAARRRALAMIRYENGGERAFGPLGNEEREGEWCDTSYGRAVPDTIVKAVLP
jgi:hypothetical protein